jgi:hypothetical protein
MTAPRTRLDRVRASAGIVRLALQQIEDELAEDITAQELAQILREMHREDAPKDGVLAGVAQLLTVSARTAERLDTDGDGDTSGPLHDAADLLTDNTSVRLYWATRVLDPQGEHTP